LTAKKIAAIGYCFGGGVVLNMALQGDDLKGVASFHGSLGAVKEVKRSSVKAKIIIFNGDADKFNTPEQIKAIQEKWTKPASIINLFPIPERCMLSRIRTRTNTQRNSTCPSLTMPGPTKILGGDENVYWTEFSG